MVLTSSRWGSLPRPNGRELLSIVDAMLLPTALLGVRRDERGAIGGFETLHANDAARRFFSLPQGSLDLLSALHAGERTRVISAFARCLEDGAPLELRVTARRDLSDARGPADAQLLLWAHKVGDGLLLRWQPDDEHAIAADSRVAARDAGADVGRLAVLQRVTAALMDADSVDEVANVILDELFAAKPLAAGVVAVLDDTTDSLRLAAARGLPAEMTARRARMAMSTPLPVIVATRTGKPEWLSTREELLAAYPNLERADGALTQAIAALPLEADLGPVGALAISFTSSTAFDDDLKGFLITLARQCARAVERAMLIESERVARVRAARLQRVTERLADAETQEQVAQLAVNLLEETLEAKTVSCYFVDPEAGALLRAAASPGALGDGAPLSLPIGGDAELAACVRAKQARYPEASAADVNDRGASGANLVHLPLLHDGKAIGGVTLALRSSRRSPPDERGFHAAVVHQLSLALERARLREDNQRRSRHLAVLADASAAFAAAALDVSGLVQAVVRFVAQTVGDACVLSFVSEDGAHLDAVALEARSPQEEALFWRVLEERPLRVGEGVTGAVVVSGQPVLLPTLEQRPPGSRPAPPYEQIEARFAGGGILVVPLRAHDQTTGALTLFRGPGTRYTRDDLALLKDVGDRAALALYTARLYDEAQGAVRVRDDFLSIAGHELRTPLTALHLQLQAMVRFPEQSVSVEMVQERARKMAQQTHRLARLITELLDVSRIIRGRLTLETSEVDLVELCRHVVDMCDADLRRAGCALTVTAPATLSGRWDRTRIEQVLQNLLLNACKYGRARPIEIELRAEQARAIIVVRDDGIGIPLEDQARIFERFERAVPSRHFGGFGLGLWISREVVEAHGGHISVESAPERGATFRVELPLAGSGR